MSAPQGAPDLSAPVRIVLVRHGVTDFTTSGRLDGRGGADPDLSDRGRAQAHAAAAGMATRLSSPGRDAGEVRVVASPLRRARATAAAIAEALRAPVEVEPDLEEMSFGDWDGLSLGEIARRDPDAIERARIHDVPPSGGETYAELKARVLPVLDRWVAEAHAGGARTVVAVTHHGPIAVVLGEVLGIDLAHVWRLAVDPASFTTVCLWRDGGVVVESVNDTAHLRDRRPSPSPLRRHAGAAPPLPGTA